MRKMASNTNSVEGHSEYLFNYLITIDLNEEGSRYLEKFLYLAIDQFTDHIYILIINEEPGSGNLSVFSQSGKWLRSFINEKTESTYYGMAIHRNSIYLVLGLSCFQHFKVSDSISLIGSKNDKGSGIGEFMEPKQLDISNEGDLFVADFGNNRVQILDCNLQYKRHISHHSMLKPCDIKLTPDEVYVLGDSPEQSTHYIHVFTHMGDKLRSVILNGIPNSMRCSSFCVDTCGNIIIIDDVTSQIKFFAKEENLCETMAITGRFSSEYKHPIGVAWMINQKLVVLSKYFNDILEIYSYI